ncbi:MAG: Hsp20/alpha crystallin family protein [Candidatus Binatia bacterium]
MARSPSRWDADWQVLGDPIDEIFDRLLGFTAVPRYGLQQSWRPAVDAFRARDGIIVIAELPGVEHDDVQVSVDGDRLRIAGSRRPPQLADADPQRLEIDYGPFERLVALPPDSDGERITADLRHGLLTVRIPRRASARRVTVRVVPAPEGSHE